ncbi:non-ribosomal peptide synthetase [Flavobacterium sp. N502536]|uniref:non-ribosomal peptide synthetase n=1 Tax=Flavobacterium sp. N502536 TaxID=2986837 RepID=UPI002222A875|nr:amino acid adenylation domain-containing protein [Flavobacterium sp. N502536]
MKIKEIYALNPLQEGIFFRWQISDKEYFEQSCYHIYGKVEVELLHQTFDFLVSRHDALRTCFNNTTVNDILQVVLESVPSGFNYQDESANKNFSLENFKKSDREKGFNLNKGSQIRLTVIKLQEDVFEFIWSYHHIILDGWSAGILIKDFFYVYKCLLAGHAVQLSPAPSNSAYSKWLMQLDKKSIAAYWEDYLSGFETNTGIPFFNPENQKEEETEVKTIHTLSRKNKEAVTALCQKLGITENIFFQTIWGMLLAKYNDTEDVVFGSVVSGRPSEVDRIEEMLGLFINTIPVRIKFDAAATLRNILIATQKEAIESIPNHYIQLAEIQSKSNLGQQLFDTLVVYENYPAQEYLEEELINSAQDALKVVAVEAFEKTNYNFSLAIVPGIDTLLRFTYNAQKYSPEFIENLKKCFEHLYTQVLENPDSLFSEIDLVAGEERNRLFFDFNRETFDISASHTIISYFSKQVLKNPNKTAVKYNTESLSYQELDEKSNKLGHYLIDSYGIKEHDFVAVELERSEMLIVTILAIFKLGAVYVPIDTHFPEERKKIITESSQCVLVVNENNIKEFENSTQNDAALNREIKPSQIAYTIYTSGSTGKPKGVMVTHQNFSVLLANCRKKFGTAATAHFPVLASNSFDIFFFEVFYPLTIGGTITVLSTETIQDLAFLNQEIEKINAFHAVPVLMRQLLDYIIDFDIADRFSHITKVFMGGEASSNQTLEDLSKVFRNASIHVLYGPTEGTIFVTGQTYLHQQKRYNPQLIGTPNKGSKIYLLDSANNLVPIGVPGEICIAGEQVAEGYLNHEGGGREVFRIDFFSRKKLYKTGDLARWHFNGVLEFIGRKDSQIKLNGYRIELGEIEAVFQEQQKIKKAIVLADNQREDQKRIVAFYTGPEKLDQRELRNQLQQKLPAYMIPSKIVWVEEFPTLINGKTNTKALLTLGRQTAKSEQYTLPKTELEAKILNVWKTILCNENIGIQDPFFEVGGNSISLMKMVRMVNKELDINLKVLNAFKFSTIEALVNHITQDIEPVLEEADEKNLKSVDIVQQTMSILKKKQQIN